MGASVPGVEVYGGDSVAYLLGESFSNIKVDELPGAAGSIGDVSTVVGVVVRLLVPVPDATKRLAFHVVQYQ